MLPNEHQNIMTFIEENTERLVLLEKTLILEEKQKRRLQDLSLEKHKETEEARRMQLYEGNPASIAILDEEDTQRKLLVDSMVRNSTTSNGPVVKVLTNVQGKLKKEDNDSNLY